MARKSPAKGRTWRSLTPAYRRRLERQGINGRSYAALKRRKVKGSLTLSKARGHALRGSQPTFRTELYSPYIEGRQVASLVSWEGWAPRETMRWLRETRLNKGQMVLLQIETSSIIGSPTGETARDEKRELVWRSLTPYSTKTQALKDWQIRIFDTQLDINAGRVDVETTAVRIKGAI